ncbi:hypothetical protein MGG_12181 [Pyricularia oryzae 70-15]|uniref:Uncharacterized protein n=1 Tax=Pyricularia oryzae (strain 70-15 / ATCC MYA-4617 / FGSC 8958) TaxID=242507 RepID=G4NF78_PYRO7|nr:uncharacterized protein MGG_12181 [Pyricularia oryzae 70-15]EHA47226.1 hypothetical protein MGG_12181 [Pyricularia oryzae 70-15]
MDPDASHPEIWLWNPVAAIAIDLGLGSVSVFFDINGDRDDDYILLRLNCGTAIYRNV